MCEKGVRSRGWGAPQLLQSSALIWFCSFRSRPPRGVVTHIGPHRLETEMEGVGGGQELYL